MKKIYFCGSIRGGRQDAALYAELIKILGSYGQVLTEHVGKADFTLPDVEKEEGVGKDRGIFEKDMGWLKEADCVVAEVTVASTGVGWELGAAWQMGKPILALFRPHVNGPNSISAMVRGALGEKNFRFQEYKEAGELAPVFHSFLT